mmetsp:Transcript_7246/g.17294  ORF Transcript_7246/g.17294 Transcript_7246/m.17294 type:complete len:362 (-) Transcript_7246:150-1235(-)
MAAFGDAPPARMRGFSDTGSRRPPMFRGADDDDSGRPGRPSLTIRVAKHGAAPLHAFGCGLGRMIPCAPMTPVGLGAETPLPPAPPAQSPFLRGRTESAPANLEDDFSMGPMTDESSLSASGSSRMSMSSLEESDSSVSSSPRASALRQARRAKKKCLRVSFAAKIAVHIDESSSAPTPVPEGVAVGPGGLRVDADSGSCGDGAAMEDGESSDLMDDSPSNGRGLPNLHISLPAAPGPASHDGAATGFGSAPSFGGANPFAAAPMTAPASVGRPRYWGDEGPWVTDVFAPSAASPRAPIAPLQIPSLAAGVAGGEARNSPVVKRKRGSDVAGPLEDSCDADVEDGFELSADALPPCEDEDL